MNAAVQPTSWQYRSDADGITWLALDVPERSANSLSRAVLEALARVLDEIAGRPPRGLVIHSAKSSGFIAGADVNEFVDLHTEDEALRLIREGQAVMDKLARLPFPTLALIKGFCLGGGLELALACRYRIAIEDPSTRLGLPEVKLGIHPGFGGTVRSIETIGSLKALELMLTGRTVSAKQALRLGLVHEAIPERQVGNAVRYYIDRRPSAPALPLQERLLRLPLARDGVARYLERQTRAKADPRHYPAPFALIRLWREHIGDPHGMYEHEARSVARLITGETAKNLVRVFQLQDQLKSLGRRSAFQVARVHLVGAGTMGGDIAAWCALQGFDVTVEDRNLKALAATRQRATELFGQRFREQAHLRTAALDRLIADPRGIGRAKADVIIEAIFEDEAAKQKLFGELESTARPDALLATNTSSIPLERIAQALQRPERLIGLHFFNPVAKMPLVEVVRSEATPEPVLAQGLSFCRQIDKLPLPVRSAPGFLVNRILMPYLLEAVTLKAEGRSVEEIDHAALDFGMPMGPLELADTVGLDVCLHVARVLAEPMGMTIPPELAALVEAGRLGRKSGEGFYRYAKGKPVKSGHGVPIDPSLQQRLIAKLTDEAQRCLDDGIVETADQVDAGVIFGTGFAPFTGGPLHRRASLAA